MRISPEQIVNLTSWLMDSQKAEDILIMNLKEVTDIADYFVICSGESDTHVETIVDTILKGVEKEGYSPLHVEGYNQRGWVVIDFFDVVVHIFRKEIREFYNLERLWGDAKIRRLKK